MQGLCHSKRSQAPSFWVEFADSPGSGREHGGLIQAHPTHIYYVEAVNILGRGNCIADRTLINRQLDQQAVHTMIKSALRAGGLTHLEAVVCSLQTCCWECRHSFLRVLMAAILTG
ncbi:hypothetical protein EYF80_027187 [Liparis tanakae]|uniref:Uncharacterized protein n=1 Tax=Liparis tanakae TaxID=230148 RepID=A0A4Z2H9M9_9TELE|nr:hypothetical protein EYF80_027187 [Liparis tanakae]